MSGGERNKRRVARLVCQAQRGQASAFAELYQLYYSDICYYLQIRLKDHTLCAEDIAQETFLQMYKKIGQLKEPKSFTAWMYRTAHRTLLNALRSESRHKLDATEQFDEQRTEVIDAARLPESIVEDQERLDLVISCLRQLDESQRNVLLLYYMVQLNTVEIANILQRSPGTIRNQLVAARRGLKAELQNHVAALGDESTDFAAAIKVPVLSRAFQADAARHAHVLSREQAKNLTLRSLPQNPQELSSQRMAKGSSRAGTASARSRWLRVGVCTGALMLVFVTGAKVILRSPRSTSPEAEETESVLMASSQADQDSKHTQSAQDVLTEQSATAGFVPAVPETQAQNRPAQQSSQTPEPVQARPVPPVIILAHQRIASPIDGVLDPQQILMAAGARAIDSKNRSVPVELVGYNAHVFDRAGSYVFSVIARDGQGVKAKSAVIFIDVQ
ncbi:MAG: sigma-70 family RNA polymerase sigma factor [Coriobacteriia bacterium]|nr:sigma-70 family RNA polymerase sigma factor [Coriobacteriia bacterium]